MIYPETKLKVADNSGALEVKCIHINGSTGLKVAHVGEVIMISVVKAEPKSKAVKGKVYAAVIVRTVKSPVRKDGSASSFGDNAVVIVDRKSFEPIGTRVMGPVAREVRNYFPKLASLASEVV